MNSTDSLVISQAEISQVQQLLAEKGYEVSGLNADVLRVKDPDTGVSFQTALEGNVLYMSLTLATVSTSSITAEMMQKMLAADNGISTSSFQLFETGGGKTAVTLTNFCTIQNMGAEDQDDILSLAGYLLADTMEARGLLGSYVSADAPVAVS